MLRLKDGRFRNIHPHPAHGLRELLRWKLRLGRTEKPTLDRVVLPSRYQAEWVRADIERISRPSREHIQVTWIGHSTFLIQVQGMNLLTDPVFGKYCSPFPIPRLRRQAPLPVKMENLPTIHGVLLSHNHYDHLEARTVRQLGNDVTWFAPIGMGPWFAERDRDNVLEMDWWQEAEFGPISVVSVPAQHFSSRTMLDRNLTLWSGFVLRTSKGNIYFAGDSGYCSSFYDIGNHLGPMRVSMIPIGAYQPRWFMAPMHLNPEEAVRVHLDVKSELSIGMHWGTFSLTDEPMAEPPIMLRHSLARRHVPATTFRTLRIGETILV
jgi:N-acyl-phosphatidylethanolamine-hydrolysing phospholipase D